MNRIIILLLLAGTLADISGLLQASRIVRISLRKHTSMQAGHLGQPMTSYFARTEFGSPPKPFNMLIDLNAREVWLPHYLKMGLVYSRLNYKNGYSKKGSKTSIKEPDEIYKMDFKDCELSGKAYQDVVRFKDVEDSIQPVEFKQRFLVISSASNSKFTQFSPADGVLAFAPWPISETGSDLVSVSMRRANLTSELKFGLALDSDLSDGLSGGGELTIGGVNSHKTNASTLRFHGLVAQHSWEVNLQNVMLGANSIDACPRKMSNQVTCSALLSTTTNDIYGPTEPIKAMLKLLGFPDVDTKFDHSTLYEIDCLKVATAPTLTFVIDGQYYSIPPTSYIKKKEDGYIFKSSTCYVALLSNLSDNKWELGTNFLSTTIQFSTWTDARWLLEDDFDWVG